VNETDLNRVREDLAVIRQAAGTELPFNQQDVWIMTSVACVAGGTIVCIGWWVPWEYRWVALFPVTLLMGVWFSLARSSYRGRAAEPARWRETRFGMTTLYVLMPGVIGFMLLEKAVGMSWAAVSATAMFFLGFGTAQIAVLDRTRRHYFASALSFMAFGLALSFCKSYQAAAVGAGAMLMTAALFTAVIQLWQLRGQQRQRSNTDVH
jgi:hypothetical protein